MPRVWREWDRVLLFHVAAEGRMRTITDEKFQISKISREMGSQHAHMKKPCGIGAIEKVCLRVRTGGVLVALCSKKFY